MKRLFFTLALSVLLSGCGSNSDREPLVTFKEYQQVKTGMTLSEVEGIVGASGDRKGGTDGDDGYSWMNQDGTGLVVNFEKGKVYDKGSVGNLK